MLQRECRPDLLRIVSKKTLFNMLQPWIPGSRFLDLFAGSGAIGIEALSRGALRCVFVERGRAAVSCIRENLKKTRLEENSRILAADVMNALKELNGQETFSCILWIHLIRPVQKRRSLLF